MKPPLPEIWKKGLGLLVIASALAALGLRVYSSQEAGNLARPAVEEPVKTVTTKPSDMVLWGSKSAPVAPPPPQQEQVPRVATNSPVPPNAPQNAKPSPTPR